MLAQLAFQGVYDPSDPKLIPILEMAAEAGAEKAIARLAIPANVDSTPAVRYLSLPEAAEFLGVAQQTIYQNKGTIPHFKKFGRLYFKEKELIDFLESGRQV